MDKDCLFCKIAAGTIPSSQVYSDEKIIVFRDIAPAAPVHLLAVTRRHIPSAAALTIQDAGMIGHIFAVIAQNAGSWGLEGGFRVITNVGHDAGQTVEHLHFHILGGHALSISMG